MPPTPGGQGLALVEQRLATQLAAERLDELAEFAARHSS